MFSWTQKIKFSEGCISNCNYYQFENGIALKTGGENKYQGGNKIFLNKKRARC